MGMLEQYLPAAEAIAAAVGIGALFGIAAAKGLTRLDDAIRSAVRERIEAKYGSPKLGLH